VLFGLTSSFRPAKIQNFESDSQQRRKKRRNEGGSFRPAKIQNFESDSQQQEKDIIGQIVPFDRQRYKILKAIHNHLVAWVYFFPFLSTGKDTKF